jgi:hypothetical protein
MHMRICHTDCQHTYLCWKADKDPSSCSPCPSNDGEDATCEGTDQCSFEETLVQIEDVSRNTTVQSILNIVGLRLSRLGFTEMTLRMAYISPTSSEPQAPINPCQVHVYSTQLGRGFAPCKDDQSCPLGQPIPHPDY